VQKKVIFQLHALFMVYMLHIYANQTESETVGVREMSVWELICPGNVCLLSAHTYDITALFLAMTHEGMLLLAETAVTSTLFCMST